MQKYLQIPVDVTSVTIEFHANGTVTTSLDKPAKAKAPKNDRDLFAAAAQAQSASEQGRKRPVRLLVKTLG